MIKLKINLQGVVSTSNIPCIKVMWKITSFTQTSRKIGCEVQSPSFSFAGASWRLELEPNGIEGQPDVIRIYLRRLNSPVSEHSLIARMGLKTHRGEQIERIKGLVDECYPFLGLKWPKRSLVDPGDFPFSKGTVTVFCHLRLKTQPREASLPLPVSPRSSLDSSRGNQNVAGNGVATHSVSSHPNSQENFGSNLSEMKEFEGEVWTSNVPCIEVTWKIPNFAQTLREIDYDVESPAFFFDQASWCLGLSPNGDENYRDCMFISLCRKDSSVSDHSVIARMCFKTDRGEEYRSVCTKYFIDENDKLFYLHYEKRSHVEACDFLLPKGTATVFCQLRIKSQPAEVLLELPVRRDGGLETSRDDQIIAGNSGATLSASSQPELLNSSTQTDEPQTNSAGIHNLQSDYKKLLETEEEVDVCLKVSDKELPALKCFLRARSSVLSVMFKHDTEENSGDAVIKGLDPKFFPDFLRHVHAGSVDTLSEENVFSLYTAADKYDMADLKSECKSYMERTLSVDTFCDVMVVALRYKEDELLKLAIDFFSKNLTKIIVTVKWQKFIEGNVTAGNELFIKAFVPSTEE